MVRPLLNLKPEWTQPRRDINRNGHNLEETYPGIIFQSTQIFICGQSLFRDSAKPRVSHGFTWALTFITHLSHLFLNVQIKLVQIHNIYSFTRNDIINTDIAIKIIRDKNIIE